MQHLLVKILSETMMSIILELDVVFELLVLCHHLAHGMQVCFIKNLFFGGHRFCIENTWEEFLKL